MTVLKTSGEVSALVGYFFQYEIFATEIYNQLLKNELEWVEFASNTSGKLDDVLLATSDTIFAYQAKEIGSSNFSYSEFTKADPESIFQGVFHGWQKIKANYPDKKIEAKFLSTQSVSNHDRIASFDGKEKPSFEKFLKNFWEQISRGTYDDKTIPKVWEPVFNELKASVKTSSSELVLFIKDFSFVFNYQVNQFVSDTYTQARRQGHIENITKEIARLVSKQGTVKLTHAQFLSSFNLKNQFETRFQHAFFVDERHYQPITATAEALDQVIGRKKKGYIALIGNAGSGKSTLLTKWLEDGEYQVLKYYAYTNTDMNYDFGYRGEATHFLHDLLVQIREKEFTIQDRLPEKDLDDLQIHLAAELKKLGRG